MNSLNLISARVIGQSPYRFRSKAVTPLESKTVEEPHRGRSGSKNNKEDETKQEESAADTALTSSDPVDQQLQDDVIHDEKQPLLATTQKELSGFRSRIHNALKRIAQTLTAIAATIGMPIVYVAKCFRDEKGHYSVLVPFKRRKRNQKETIRREPSEKEAIDDQLAGQTKLDRSYSSDRLISLSSAESSPQTRTAELDEDETPARRRSSRIRLLQNDDVTKRHQKRKSLQQNNLTADGRPLSVDSIKSPISASTTHKLKYPHAPQPPRPLIPRRQPSYSSLLPSPSSSRRFLTHPKLPQKTLVLDLDETLIHSVAKGNRMSTGHMVEVKLNVPVLNPVTQALPSSQSSNHQPYQPPVLLPQHPILYYVHKRPHVDEFLRKVSKWYRVVVFTASVQEYADPVVDWLEAENPKKYFSARYYRQHCTFRSNNYIKDLSSVEPDLSRVIILDNSPVCYAFQEDNAIPISGWTSDPTDNDLLHLVPLLEALQYTTDVRAVLALRRGEAQTDSHGHGSGIGGGGNSIAA